MSCKRTFERWNSTGLVLSSSGIQPKEERCFLPTVSVQGEVCLPKRKKETKKRKCKPITQERKTGIFYVLCFQNLSSPTGSSTSILGPIEASPLMPVSSSLNSNGLLREASSQ